MINSVSKLSSVMIYAQNLFINCQLASSGKRTMNQYSWWETSIYVSSYGTQEVRRSSEIIFILNFKGGKVANKVWDTLMKIAKWLKELFLGIFRAFSEDFLNFPAAEPSVLQRVPPRSFPQHSPRVPPRSAPQHFPRVAPCSCPQRAP